MYAGLGQPATLRATLQGGGDGDNEFGGATTGAEGATGLDALSHAGMTFSFGRA